VTESTRETITHNPSAGAPETAPDLCEGPLLLVGVVLKGRYLLERAIGEGGMGMVFQARDLEEERIALEGGGTASADRLAIKLLRPELRQDALRQLEELRRTRTLVHQNIVRAGDCQQEGQLVFMTMELLEGRPLDQLLDRDFAQGVPWDLARTLIAEMGAGLSYAHDRGFVHCDLKPSNIFVTQAFRAKILDFGIARALRGDRSTEGSSTHLGLTPRYASPEMLRAWRAERLQDHHPDRRDDIFALGCIVYELLTGTHPFGNDIGDAEEAAQRGWTLPSIDGLTSHQQQLLADTLVFDRAKRTSRVDQFVDGFVAALPARRTGVLTRWRSPRWLWAGVTAAALLVTTAAIVVSRAWPGLLSFAVPSTPSAAPTAPGLAAPSRSVVVFGFSNLTGDPKDYFSAGISEEVMNALTRINQLHVRAGPPLSPDGPSIDVSAVARKLNVANILQGSVRKTGAHLRVAVQLIDVGNGDHLWSHIYDRELKDALDLQIEIAERVASTLNVTLLGDVRQHLATGGTKNPEAYEAYLRARYGETTQDRAGLRGGLEALDEAIRLDPQYANAYAFRANLQGQYASEWASAGPEREELTAGARKDAQKGVALAPNSANAHLELAIVYSAFGINFRDADAEYHQALKLEPGNGEVRVRYAEWASQFGRQETATMAGRGSGNLGTVLYRLRRFEEARPILRAIADQTQNPVIRSWAGQNELALDDPTHALKYCQDKTFNYAQLCMAIAYHKLGRRKEAQDMLALMTKSQGDDGAYNYAEIYASWGDRERALHWLERAVELQDSGLSGILCDVFLDSLRQEPRFKQVVARLDLPT
jgi:serine/threonine protein kinase/tetratricopeptide (TPR) repeat protein